MGLLSIFKRQAGAGPSAPRSGAANAADSSDAVLLARTRARHRLIGAAVLLLAGVIGFPIVFETQPRPVAVNAPIEVPSKDGAPALIVPAARPAAPVAASAVAAESPAQPAAKPSAPAENIITEASGDAGRDVTPSASAVKPAAPAAKPATEPAAKPAPAPKPAAEPKTAAVTKPEAKPATDAARAKALLDGEPAAAPATKATDASGRFVVQVGAFADNAAAHEVRVKADKHGIKTYAQVAETASGKRYRVRIGPFASRDEADKALAKARAAGLSAVVLTL